MYEKLSMLELFSRENRSGRYSSGFLHTAGLWWTLFIAIVKRVFCGNTLSSIVISLCTSLWIKGTVEESRKDSFRHMVRYSKWEKSSLQNTGSIKKHLQIKKVKTVMVRRSKFITVFYVTILKKKTINTLSLSLTAKNMPTIMNVKIHQTYELAPSSVF